MEGQVDQQRNSDLHCSESLQQKALVALWTQGIREGRGRRAYSGKVMSSESKERKSIFKKKYHLFLLGWFLRKRPKEDLYLRLLIKKPLNEGTGLGTQLWIRSWSMGGRGRGLTATLFRDGRALAMHQVLFGEGSFPPWGLPSKPFIIAYSWAWKKITHRFWTRSWTSYSL